jgi:hypothetical protein
MNNKLHLVQKNCRLTCAWVATGDVKMPLICIWIASGTPSFRRDPLLRRSEDISVRVAELQLDAVTTPLKEVMVRRTLTPRRPFAGCAFLLCLFDLCLLTKIRVR